MTAATQASRRQALRARQLAREPAVTTKLEQARLFTQTAAEQRELETDARDREDDPTPRELVRAVLTAAMPVIMRELGEDEPGWGIDLDALDVCAGYGAWASELRCWCALSQTEVLVTGAEICDARAEHLAKWCDRVEIGDWRETISAGSWDVAIGNPHFSALVGEAGPETSMPARLLEVAPAVLLFHQTASFQRGLRGVEVWRRYPPARVWLVPGSVGFRGPGTQTDSRSYQATLWVRGHEGPALVEMLPGPPAGASWRWTVPPGSEEPSEELPAAPGWVRP